MPGTTTLNGVLEALEYGADVVKIFPGEILGMKAIKAIHGPIPQGATDANRRRQCRKRRRMDQGWLHCRRSRRSSYGRRQNTRRNYGTGQRNSLQLSEQPERRLIYVEKTAHKSICIRICEPFCKSYGIIS